MINTPKKTLGDYTFDEVGTFSVEQLAGVSFDRQFSPLTNVARDLSQLTWENITTTWSSETHTWGSSISDMTNTAVKSLGSYTFDEIGTFSIDQVDGHPMDSQFSPLTNTSKPI